MENKYNKSISKGEMEMAVNDTIEIISASNPEIYGKVATIVDIKESTCGRDLRIQTSDGLDIWIDANDAVIY